MSVSRTKALVPLRWRLLHHAQDLLVISKPHDILTSSTRLHRFRDEAVEDHVIQELRSGRLALIDSGCGILDQNTLLRPDHWLQKRERLKTRNASEARKKEIRDEYLRGEPYIVHRFVLITHEIELLITTV